MTAVPDVCCHDNLWDRVSQGKDTVYLGIWCAPPTLLEELETLEDVDSDSEAGPSTFIEDLVL